MKNTFLALFLMIFCLPGFGQSVSIQNGPGGTTWSPSIPAAVTSAGKNYETTEVSSATNQTLIKVVSGLYWEIRVHQSVSSNWDPALKLYVKRTGDGQGLVTIAGGTNFIQLTSSPQLFFNGLLGLGFGRENIPVQYKIDGLSVTVPVKTYTTTIQYTVVGL